MSRHKWSKGTIIPLGQHTTIMQAKMIGIEAAAQLAIQEGGCRRVYICSGSKAAFSALQSMDMESKLKLECYSVLYSVAEKKDVVLLWISSHFGIKGNEIADDLARLAAGKPILDPEPAVGISYSQITAHLKMWEEDSNR